LTSYSSFSLIIVGGSARSICCSLNCGALHFVSSVKIKEGGLDLFYFYFYLFLYFLFLEQLGLGLIGHAITSVT